jgi:fatty-acyl-CoA synthase
MTSKYDRDLGRTPANFQPLTPLGFLARAAHVHPDHPAVIHHRMRLSYADLYSRCRRLASALAAHGIGKNDSVSVILPNVPPMIECHYGVPMVGAVLNAINTRLDPATIAYILDHAETRALIVDREFAVLAREALALATVQPLVIDYDDRQFRQGGPAIGSIDYEALLSKGDPRFEWSMPDDEWNAISLNYTSGTTGHPKGVVYHHRGAALLAQGNVLTGSIPRHAVYLWTLPMFHCNGWCFPWTISVVAGTHVCLRAVRRDAIWSAIADHDVTHMSGAPIVMSTILSAAPNNGGPSSSPITFFVAGAPPPAAILAEMAATGFHVVHVYGLTEVYGPAVVNEWKNAWDDMSAGDQAQLKARQGVCYVALEGLCVMDPENMTPVESDGEAIGEVMLRGNVVMKGYLKDAAATAQAFAGGWFHSGDLAVVHPDGYIQLKDRSKDIIISGGENISSIEVEDVLYKHPAISACAVVARPDPKWGETPCAFVELKPGCAATAMEVIAWARGRMAGFKSPRTVIFLELPRTSTGKIQKFRLRELAAKF